MYDTFADVYDELFPMGPRQKEFLSGFLRGSFKSDSDTLAVLDIGCGTGEALSILPERNRTGIFGIDPDDGMLAAARKKLPNGHFLALSMEEVAMLRLENGPIPCGGYDLVICLGNTLPHIGSREKAARFFIDLKALLGPGNSVVIQTLNYDRILPLLNNSHELTLPPLESEHFTMTREYRLERAGSHLCFVTEVRTRTGIHIGGGETLLIPVLKEELEHWISSAGLIVSAWYADYDREPWSESGALTIVTAHS